MTEVEEHRFKECTEQFSSLCDPEVCHFPGCGKTRAEHRRMTEVEKGSKRMTEIENLRAKLAEAEDELCSLRRLCIEWGWDSYTRLPFWLGAKMGEMDRTRRLAKSKMAIAEEARDGHEADLKECESERDRLFQLLQNATAKLDEALFWRDAHRQSATEAQAKLAEAEQNVTDLKRLRVDDRLAERAERAETKLAKVVEALKEAKEALDEYADVESALHSAFRALEESQK